MDWQQIKQTAFSRIQKNYYGGTDNGLQDLMGEISVTF